MMMMNNFNLSQSLTVHPFYNLHCSIIHTHHFPGFFAIEPVAGITVALVPVAMEVRFTLAAIDLLMLSAILPAWVWLEVGSASHLDFLLLSSGRDDMVEVISVLDPAFLVAVTNSTLVLSLLSFSLFFHIGLLSFV